MSDVAQLQPLFDTEAYAKGLATAKAFAGLQEWVAPGSEQLAALRPSPSSPKGACTGDKDAERMASRPVLAFVLFVVQHLACFVDAIETDFVTKQLGSYHQIVPCANTGGQQGNNSDSPAAETGIRIQNRGANIKVGAELQYSDLLCGIVTSASKTQRAVDKAYAELMRSTCCVFENQYNRRFAFGLTACANEARLCLFAHDAVFSSRAIDVTTTAGRQTFVQLLVNLSLCDLDQLGYDPSIRRDRRRKCWSIKCPSIQRGRSGKSAKKTFFFDRVEQQASGLFGTRTRHFMVTDEVPTGGEIRPKYRLTDEWPEAAEFTDHSVRDEVRLVCHTIRKLADKDAGYMARNKIIAGGRACFDVGTWAVKDSSKTVLGSLSDLHLPDNSTMPFRAHRWLVQ
ncbi:hypothetical protein FBU59_002040 [Linderina macrospora]|uniref:Uncharacterized protein n=1 Tax=Linderina macrospora TaxID=4868 RepID=A0ACC1JCM0_9FUNG|nr:hypothetical protein FBU59_002040 [Linderina macrospora]